MTSPPSLTNRLWQSPAPLERLSIRNRLVLLAVVLLAGVVGANLYLSRALERAT